MAGSLELWGTCTVPQILGDERQFRFEQMSGYLQNTGNNNIYLSYAKAIAILL